MLSLQETGFLLSALCTQFGLCLSPEARRAVLEQAPADAVSFTEAVFAAEGLDDSTAKRTLYRDVLALVEEVFANRRP